MRIETRWTVFSVIAVLAAPAAGTMAQEYARPPAYDSAAAEFDVEAARPSKPMVHIGPKGVFHLQNAPVMKAPGQPEMVPGNRGIFKTYGKGGPLHWCNTFEQIRKADKHYWHYQMVGFSYEVALAKRPTCCGHYKVYVRNPVQGPTWHFYQYATRRPPIGNDQAN